MACMTVACFAVDVRSMLCIGRRKVCFVSQLSRWGTCFARFDGTFVRGILVSVKVSIFSGPLYVSVCRMSTFIIWVLRGKRGGVRREKSGLTLRETKFFIPRALIPVMSCVVSTARSTRVGDDVRLTKKISPFEKYDSCTQRQVYDIKREGEVCSLFFCLCVSSFFCRSRLVVQYRRGRRSWFGGVEGKLITGGSIAVLSGENGNEIMP